MVTPVASPALDREFAFDDEDFAFLVRLVHDKTGIVLADHKRDMVYSRLARRLRFLKLLTFADYCAFLEGRNGDSEMGQLVNAITTNLTSFFREMHHFEHLQKEVLPEILASENNEKRLRLWSAGCSMGMEAYSMAMILKEHAYKMQGWDAKILATDIDTHVLSVGTAGQYSFDDAKNIPAPYRKKYFHHNAEKIWADDALKKLVAFKRLNLLGAWPIKGKFDVIFCRNVVIYFDRPTQKILFSRFADALNPKGWLYIGHSENLFNVCDRFKLMGRTIYRKIS